MFGYSAADDKRFIKHSYRVLISVSPFVCQSFRLCVCVHDYLKINALINLKLWHIEVYGNCADEFYTGHCSSKVKVTVQLRNFSQFKFMCSSAINIQHL